MLPLSINFLLCCPFAVQIREEQLRFPTGLEREAGSIHTCQRGGGAQRQEQQRLRCQILRAAHDWSQPPREQIIQEMFTSFVHYSPSEKHIANPTFLENM